MSPEERFIEIERACEGPMRFLHLWVGRIVLTAADPRQAGLLVSIGDATRGSLKLKWRDGLKVSR